jgi:hypothetical protein
VAALTARLRHHYEVRTPRVEHDLSAYHIETVARETLSAYRQLTDNP